MRRLMYLICIVYQKSVPQHHFIYMRMPLLSVFLPLSYFKFTRYI